MFKIIEGSLLEANESYICHQTNCVTTKAAGLAAAIFNRFEYANCYSERSEKTKPDMPGTINICGNGTNERYVINMMAQYYPGPPMSVPVFKSVDNRFQWFRECLGKMMKLHGDMAFPWRIGCGIAEGDWDKYLGVLARFERVIKGNVVIYRLQGAE